MLKRSSIFSLQSLKTSMRNCELTWLLAAYYRAKDESLANSLKGTLGLLDWCFNGQIAKMLLQGQLKENSLALFPNFPNQKNSSLLLYNYCSLPKAKKKTGSIQLIKALKKLKVKKLCLCESTWPLPTLIELKTFLLKARIEHSSLEEKAWEI